MIRCVEHCNIHLPSTEMFHLFILSTINNSLASCFFYLRQQISFLQAQLLRYTSEDEQIKRFERHDFSGSFRHLRTIEILDFSGSMLPFVEYLLKHASVLEKFVIVPRSKSSDAYVEIVEEFLHFPRSSSSVTLCLKLD